MGGLLLLVGGGSGVVPLMAMLRARRAAPDPTPALLLYSSRTIGDVIYRAELDVLAAEPGGPIVVLALTREQPPGWDGFARRIDEPMLSAVIDRLGGAAAQPLAYVCGPTLLVEAAASGLTTLGLPPSRIRTERRADVMRPAVIDDPLVLDANAVAGDLREIMGVEVTTYVARCANCGNRARARHAPGLDARARRGAALRHLQRGRHPLGAPSGWACVDMRGAAFLQPG